MASLVCLLLLVLSGFLRSAEGFVEELNDSLMGSAAKDQIWLIKFYAPWCSFCKQLDPVWSQIGSELRSVGSEVQVGRVDGTTNTVLSKEFRVRTYPAIVLLKKDKKYHYMGPKTKDAILDFTHRVSGPSVRILSSLQLVAHALKRHKVLFLFIGATSELRSNFSVVAEELIVHTNFYSTSREHLPKWVSVPSLPAVLVFKDESYFAFSSQSGLDLKSWILRERFSTFSKLDSFSLYSMGDSGRLVLVAVLGNSRSEQSLRLKSLVQKVSSDKSRSKDFYFGFLEDLDFVSGLLMSDDVTVPRLLVLNLTNDSYFVPPTVVASEQELLWFLDSVLTGALQSAASSLWTNQSAASSLWTNQSAASSLWTNQSAASSLWTNQSAASSLWTNQSAASSLWTNQSAASSLWTNQSAASSLWTNQSAASSLWTNQSAASSLWTNQSAASSLWTNQSAASSLWTNQSAASSLWTNQSAASSLWTNQSAAGSFAQNKYFRHKYFRVSTLQSQDGRQTHYRPRSQSLALIGCVCHVTGSGREQCASENQKSPLRHQDRSDSCLQRSSSSRFFVGGNSFRSDSVSAFPLRQGSADLRRPR